MDDLLHDRCLINGPSGGNEGGPLCLKEEEGNQPKMPVWSR